MKQYEEASTIAASIKYYAIDTNISKFLDACERAAKESVNIDN